MEMELKNLDLAKLKEFATKLSAKLKIGDVVCLQGDLGAGKTTFSAYLIQALSDNPGLQVLSPTFNLTHLYNTARGSVWHFDLYRLKSASELEDIGFFDALHSGITIIEWPEIAEQFLPAECFWVEIKQGLSAELRDLQVTNKMTTF